MTILKYIGLFICTALLIATVSNSVAQPAQEGLDQVVQVKDDTPVPLFDEPTHPPVKLSPDKSKLIRLDETVAKVIVGNSNHLTILPSDKNTIVLVGRAAGATYFTALNESGGIVMQRHVFVAAPQENYVRIRRTCAASELDGCQETQMFYCPDTCHNVAFSEEESDNADATAPAGGSDDAQAPPPPAIDSASE